MIKKILFTLLCICSTASFAFSATAIPNTTSSALACGQAVATTDPGFCPSFKSIALCHCMEKLPRGMCQDMNLLYARMIDMFKTIAKACAYQHDTSVQNCIDDWNCYRSGGRNSAGQLCSSTGNACQ